MHANLELLLSRLEKVKRNGDQSWMACCPAHGDSSPSLAISETDAGKVLIKCFAGCTSHEVMDSIGLPMSTLFHPDARKNNYRDDTLRQRMRERQMMKEIAKDAMIVAMAASHVRKGETCSDDDVGLLIDISTRLERAAKEYLG